jgi:hypothetical protein
MKQRKASSGVRTIDSPRTLKLVLTSTCRLLRAHSDSSRRDQPALPCPAVGRELHRQAVRSGHLHGSLDAVVHGLRALGRVHLDRLPRMADFALWATACETALWPAGTFARAYAANRRAAIETIIEADPIATCVRAIMVDRTTWSGSASDLLRLCAESGRDDISRATAWAKNPRALAGRLRRAQTFLRRLGIEITFSREGRTGTRMIKVSASGGENNVSTVSTVSAARSNGSRGDQAILAEIRE